MSGYPITFINNIFIPLIQNRELGKNISENPSKPTHTDDDKEFVLRVPYFNEAFSRIVKKKVKEAGISARVVICPGSKLKSHISNNKSLCTTKNCIACDINIPCNTRNFVYKATCLKCDEKYIGCSARPASERIKEYESSIRLKHQNERTSLGRHKEEMHNGEKDDLKEMFNIELLAKAKDPLSVFLTEGLLIKQHRPGMNGQINNGFVL